MQANQRSQDGCHTINDGCAQQKLSSDKSLENFNFNISLTVLEVVYYQNS